MAPFVESGHRLTRTGWWSITVAIEAQYTRGTQLGASKEQEVVQAESKEQCKRSELYKVRMQSIAGTVYLRIITIWTCFKKLPSAGQGPSAENLTSRAKLPSQAKLQGRESCRVERSC